jgi:hypothetical protein
MWFDIVKLDLSQVSSQIQGDAEGRNINISEDKSCEEKYYRFIRNLYDEFGQDPWFNYSISNEHIDRGIPEELFCLLVENLDKFFSGPKPTPQSASLNNWRNRGYSGGHYSLDIHGVLAEGYSPFVITLIGPIETNYGFKKDHKIKVGFEKVYSEKLAKERYDKIQSCWERA